MTLFKTFDELYPTITGQTNYEKTHNITVLKKEIVINTDDMKLIKFTKSDKTIGLTVCFRTSPIYDSWVFWMPSQNQQDLLPIISSMIKNVDKHNEQFRKNLGDINPNKMPGM